MLKTGSVIDGKYKILNEIGHGGMSTVYLAINEKANKLWAVKEVRKSFNRDYDVLKQSLIVETDLLKKLKHPNLPSIVDIIDFDENFLIVMDYIEGNTLEKLIAQKGAQSQENVIDWALQLCDVLDYLHTRKEPVIYRDMKPSNIMLKADGKVMLIDFGTAREFKAKNFADTTCLGTQGYAAPEQFGGMGQTDARTDIYCLGATLYHLVTGHNPSEPPYEMYPITKWNKDLSTGLEKIILKCTQKNPEDRYQSIKELEYALRHYRDLEVQAQRTYRMKIKIFATALGLTAACAAGASGFSMAAEGMQSRRYQEQLDMAELTENSVEACRIYMEAVATNPTAKEAYHGFYARAVEDGIFSTQEEELFVKMNINTNKYLQRLHEKDEKEYAEFCYEMGNAYWYYYEHEENRQTRALVWFQKTLEYYESNKEDTMEYRRCMLYVKLGTFYKNVIAAQIDGTASGMYGEYWRSLIKLKHLNDEMPDREIITLRMYREIASRAVEYTRYFKEDGITDKEINLMLDELENDMSVMEKDTTENSKKEIDNIRWIIDAARKMVRSTYK